MATRLVQAKVDEGIVEWFDEHFPHGAKQQFIEDCFFALRNIVEDGTMPTFSAYARAAIRRTLGRE